MKKTIYLSLVALIVMVLACSSKASAQYTISSYHVDEDSACWSGNQVFDITLSGYTPGLQMKSYWGDGSNSLTPLTSVNGILDHHYAMAGSYTVKFVLQDATGVGMDSASFSNMYHYCQSIYVSGYIDTNGNGIFDVTDLLAYSAFTVAVDSDGTRIDTLDLIYGSTYHALGDPGTVYKFTLLSPPAGMALSSPLSGVFYDTVTWMMSGLEDKRFGFQCSSAPSFDLALIANFSAGVDGAGSHIFITNSSCTPQAATLTIYHSPKYAFVSTTSGAAAVAGNTVTINVGMVSATTPVSLVALFNPAGILAMGDTVNTRFVLTPITGDADSLNNVIVTTDTIRLSHDPNYKAVMPGGDIVPGTSLKYMLGFENTGNAPAANIHIMDTLSDNLDANTVKIGTSTHAVNLSSMQSGGHTVLKFDFAGINLPDSSHHGLCDGMVSFTVKAKATLAQGNKIDNRAGIYFDANEVVMTNTVENKIPVITAISNVLANRLQVYPNPVSKELMVTSDAGSFETATITNSIGQVYLRQDVHNGHAAINVQSLPAGIYYISLKGNGGTKTEKFEKL